MKLAICALTLALTFAHSENANAFWNGKFLDNQQRTYEKTPRNQLSMLEQVPADVLHMIACWLDHPSDLDALDATSQTLHDILSQTRGKSFNKRKLRSKLLPLIGQTKESEPIFSINGQGYSIDSLPLELQSKLQWRFSWLRRIDLERDYQDHFPGVMEIRASHISRGGIRTLLFFPTNEDKMGLHLTLENAILYCQQKADLLGIPVHQATTDEMKWIGSSLLGFEVTEYGKGPQALKMGLKADSSDTQTPSSKEEKKVPVLCVYSTAECKSDDLCTIL